MLRFLVAARLQNLGGKPHQLAEILRGEVNEVQIPGTKIDLWRPLLDTLSISSASTGFTTETIGHFNSGGLPILDLRGIDQATIVVDVDPTRTPIAIDFLQDDVHDTTPFGTLIGTASQIMDDTFRFTFGTSILEESAELIVAQARFTNDPSEDIDDIDAIYFITSTPVPAPSTLVLLGLGLVVMLYYDRRRRKQCA